MRFHPFVVVLSIAGAASAAYGQPDGRADMWFAHPNSAAIVPATSATVGPGMLP